MASRTPPVEADVVVIGCGAAGGLAAGTLALKGLDVVALEAGERLGPSDFALDEVHHLSWNAMGKAKVNHEVPTVRRTLDEEAAPATAPGLMMNGVGGSKIHASNVSFRMLPWHFRARSATVERYGEAAVPAHSTLADWPLDYAELAPYYDRVEDLYGVSGESGEGRNPFAGPQAPYPLPPLRPTGYTDRMSDAAKRKGWHPFPAPASIRTEPHRGLPACTYCGYCSWNGCWTNAKGLPTDALLPEAEASGRLKLLTGARAMEIEVDSDGMASGVRWVSRDGREWRTRAKVVLLAGYTYENVRLLLVSTSKQFPDGLANGEGQVGKHFMSHAFVMSFGVFEGRSLNSWSGSAAQAAAIDDFNADNFDHSGLGFISGSVLMAPVENKLLIHLNATPPDVPRWGSGWKDWVCRNLRSTGWAYAQLDQLPYENHMLDLDPGVRDPAGMPVVRVTLDFRENEQRQIDYLQERLSEWLLEAGASRAWHLPVAPAAVSTHAYGGTRMGDDPANSVVDRWCMAHEIPNLGVLGASCFPHAGGVNPTETVEALALRTCDHLVDKWESIIP